MSERPPRCVAVVLERTPVESPWATHQWQAASVIPDEGGEPRVLLEREGVLQKVFPGFEVALYRDEAEGYYLNMSSDAPCAFVSVRDDEEGDNEAVGRKKAFAARLTVVDVASGEATFRPNTLSPARSSPRRWIELGS